VNGDNLGPGDGLLDPDGARERVAEWKGRIDQLTANTAEMRERLLDVRETATDTNRIVEVTVDSTGELVDLRLTDRIQRVAPDVVARTILTTVAAAKAKVAARTADIVGETMGSDSAAGRAIAERLRDQ
jgi:DNA-binding protein YbaB